MRAEDADKYASLDDLKGVKGGAQTGSKPYNNCVTYCGEETTVGLAKVQDLVRSWRPESWMSYSWTI